MQQVEVRERPPVGRAVAGDADGAGLTRQTSLLVVTRSCSQRVRTSALDHDDVDVDRGDLDAREAVALLYSVFEVGLLEPLARELPIEAILDPALHEVRVERVADHPDGEEQRDQRAHRKGASQPAAAAERVDDPTLWILAERHCRPCRRCRAFRLEPLHLGEQGRLPSYEQDDQHGSGYGDDHGLINVSEGAERADIHPSTRMVASA